MDRAFQIGDRIACSKQTYIVTGKTSSTAEVVARKDGGNREYILHCTFCRKVQE